MATVASTMYEEKLSPKLDDPYNKRTEKDFESEKLDGKSDTVLDEIAAKANAFDALPEDNHTHLKCKSTLEEERATVEVLINQLRYMSEEYEEAVTERDYYESLNEALLLCLEIREGKIEVEDDSSDEEDIRNLLDCEMKDGPRIVITPTGDDAGREEEDADNDSREEGDTTKQQKDTEKGDVSSTDAGSTRSGDVKPPTNEKSNKGKSRGKIAELRLNDLLLEEIIKRQDESELLNHRIYEYIEDDFSQSTATDDNEEEHVCEACGMEDGDDSEDTEDYEGNEAMEIADESD